MIGGAHILQSRYPSWGWFVALSGTHLVATSPPGAAHVDVRRTAAGRWVARAFDAHRAPLAVERGASAVEAVEALVAALESAPAGTED